MIVEVIITSLKRKVQDLYRRYYTRNAICSYRIFAISVYVPIVSHIVNKQCKTQNKLLPFSYLHHCAKSSTRTLCMCEYETRPITISFLPSPVQGHPGRLTNHGTCSKLIRSYLSSKVEALFLVGMMNCSGISAKHSWKIISISMHPPYEDNVQTVSGTC